MENILNKDKSYKWVIKKLWRETKTKAAAVIYAISIIFATAIVFPASADFNLEREMSLEYDQLVKGTGFFTSYKYAFMPDLLDAGVESKSQTHGSGSINESYSTYAFSSFIIDVKHDQDEENDTLKTPCGIQFEESRNMIFSPVTIAVNRGHYARNPIQYASLLTDRNCLKNYDTGSAMKNAVKYAHSLQKDMLGVVDYIDQGNNTMSVDEKITDGWTDLGILQIVVAPVRIEETYIGTFHIRKGLYHPVYSTMEEVEESWLPCCYAGVMGTLPM